VHLLLAWAAFNHLPVFNLGKIVVDIPYPHHSITIFNTIIITRLAVFTGRTHFLFFGVSRDVRSIWKQAGSEL
jgi:hypothetical protein